MSLPLNDLEQASAAIHVAENKISRSEPLMVVVNGYIWSVELLALTQDTHKKKILFKRFINNQTIKTLQRFSSTNITFDSTVNIYCVV